MTDVIDLNDVRENMADETMVVCLGCWYVWFARPDAQAATLDEMALFTWKRILECPSCGTSDSHECWAEGSRDE